MKILIANPGSTSYKCKLYDVPGMQVLYQATVERIGDRRLHLGTNANPAASTSDASAAAHRRGSKPAPTAPSGVTITGSTSKGWLSHRRDGELLSLQSNGPRVDARNPAVIARRLGSPRSRR